ncbi:dihydroxyacetone kinase subunit DhaL [Caldilinea sp.]|uniref:dihydroxyacetone kinase subunit DhaL n=1 Tax=Caldilinea sp. TaxID=2293560 RepID=UPI002C56204D|nr:dihydroxyacetone kinase subunit L [Anaerolineales bacterium]HQY92163.1 dihydroxyacetone kinase subunit DhaL [Caldilinea sp.]HRA66823.1 dihydroxyacetone kinase subunit DhaL [Caldilinea sp.]
MKDAEKDAERVVRRWLTYALESMVAHEQELGLLDAAAGDGDHGATMVRGLRAAHAAAKAANGSAGDLLVVAGAAFADAGGGASGALLGALITTVGRGLGDGPYDLTTTTTALQAGLATITRLGKAHPGDKTLIDALQPFVDALTAQPADQPLIVAWRAALPAAVAGVAATQTMVAKRGRAAKLGERSQGHPDPGAVSLTYLLQAMSAVWDENYPS